MKILRAIFPAMVLAVGLHARAQTDVATYVLDKQINYDQSSTSAPTLDPIAPYQFYSHIVPGTSGALFTEATLTPPAGATGVVSYQTGPYGTSNLDNSYFAQNFTSKAALDAAFPSGTGFYDFIIQNNTPANYVDQMSLGADNYPPIPQLTSVTYGPSNTPAAWNGGVLVIPSNTQSITFTWNTPGTNGSTYFSITGTSYSGYTSATSLTIPGNVLSNNTFYHAKIGFSNGYGAGASNTGTIPGAQGQDLFGIQLFFNILIGSPGTLSITHQIEKDHFVVQTSNYDPIDAPGDFNFGKERAPYSLYVRSPVSQAVTGPNNTSIPVTFAASGGIGPQGDYQYLGDPVTSASSLNALFPDGVYDFHDGTQVNLASSYSLAASAYPSAPKVLYVNGGTPAWTPQGQLILDPTISNTITWSSVNVPNLTTTGNETCDFASLGDSTYTRIDKYAGLWGSPANSPEFTTLTIPANTTPNTPSALTAGNTYCCQLTYAASSSAGPPSGTNYYVASYGTQTEFYIIAKYPTGLLQAIRFATIPDQIPGGPPVALAATASSGLPITYSVGSGPATISGPNNDMVATTGPGTVIVRASQPGNGTYAAAANASQTFTVTQPTINFVLKEHIVLQSSNSAPADPSFFYTSPTTGGGGPYGFYTTSAQSGWVTGPGGSYPLSPTSNYYYYQSQAFMSQASLDAVFPDGTYYLTDGNSINLTGDEYPAAPQLIQVNGATPVWNSAGQLVLDPSQQNTLTWTAFPTTYGSFSAAGLASVRVFGNQDSVRDGQFAVGPFGGTAFNTHVIPPGTLTSGNTYSSSFSYTIYPTFTAVAPNAYDYPEYTTENDFTVAAGSVTGVSQAVNFPAVGDQTYGAGPITLGATTTSGLPVSYSVVSGPARISGNTLTITGAGTVYVMASQAGNGTYAAASAELGFNVYPAPLTITFNYQSKVVGQPFEFIGTEFALSGLQNGETISSIMLASAGAAQSAPIASYPISVSNLTGSGFNSANYAISYVGGNMDVISGPPVQTFATWESVNSVTTGSAGMPNRDGVPNLLKYFFDIVPGTMTADDRAALPTLGEATIGGQRYLTLNYRQCASATGVLITPQTSSDMTNWSPTTSVQTDTDANTGDPIMSVLVPASGNPHFIRLNVGGP